MIFDRTGIILYTQKYAECVSFYKDILELPILFTTEMLTCFKFGSAYLMVEIDDQNAHHLENGHRIRTCLRLNVKQIEPLVENLKSHKISVDHQKHDWGEVAKFYDPDGNLCAFKDSATFEKQVLEFRK